MSGEPVSPERYQIIDQGPTTRAAVTADIARVQRELPNNRFVAMLRGLHRLQESAPRDGESFSLLNLVDTKDKRARFRGEGGDSIIEPRVGSFIVDTIDAPDVRDVLKEFYHETGENKRGNQKDKRIHRKDEGGAIELRGASYFVASDYEQSPRDVLFVMNEDFAAAVKVIKQIEETGRPRTEREFLMYLGVLDYLKIHAISLLHFATYDEREGNIPEDRAQYLQMRNQVVELARSSVRKYYQVALRLPFDSDITLDTMQETMLQTTEFLKQREDLMENTKDNRMRFPFPESNNPLVNLLGAHEAVLRTPDIQTIVGIQSGGTETAILAQLLYEYRYNGFSPDLVSLPFSLYSGRSNAESYQRTPEEVAEVLKGINPDVDFADKSVLLVDDNSNTGSTLQTVADALVEHLDARRTTHHLIDHDFDHMLVNIDKGRKLFFLNVVRRGYQSIFGHFKRNKSEIEAILDVFHENQVKKKKKSE